LPKIGLIGGSGIYDPELIEETEKKDIDTPFGKPSSPPIVGKISGRDVAFIPRHGENHLYNPSEVNYRANIYALKKLGVRKILATNAVGSLKKNIEPLDVVIPNQIFDRTKNRNSTFFEDGIVAHIGFAEPFCPTLSSNITNYSSKKYSIQAKGTYVCIEGPMFSTKSESNFYRNQGFDIIGMTAIPEAKLAREGEMCYSMIATVTDYDVWHEDEEVTMELVKKRMAKNLANLKDILSEVIPNISLNECQCENALQNTIATNEGVITRKTERRLKHIVSKYL